MLLLVVITIAVIACSLSATWAADPALGSYNIGSDITVSGLSSGAFMAVQVNDSTAVVFFVCFHPLNRNLLSCRCM
jgi:hypothetical protein